MADGAVVVGVGQTEYSWDSGRSELALALEAVHRALDDAGLEPASVDGIVRASFESTPVEALSDRLGVPPLRFAADDGNGPAFACGLVGLADAAIRTGRARVVVAYRAFNGRSGRRLGRPDSSSVSGATASVRAHGPAPVGGEFSGPYGLLSPAHVFALWCQAYVDRYRIDDGRFQAALGAVATHQRACAVANPGALLREKPLTTADYQTSPVLAEPLRRADLCLEADGACAVVFAAPEIARDCSRPPVAVIGAGQGLPPGYRHLFLDRGEVPPRAPTGLVPDLLAASGLSLGDVDVFGTYDACSANVVFDIETMGWCKLGEGAEWVLSPRAPYNTGGGMLGEVYLQGMNQLVEVVRQLRGQAARQVDGAEVGLVTSAAVGAAAVLAGGLGSS